MLVSVIIPVYNRGAMAREAIDCAMNQTYPHIEIIVVDDGSDDGTYGLLEEISSQNSRGMTLLRQCNKGPGPARNLGLSVAKGEFVQFLDSDDLLGPAKLERQVAALLANESAGVSYCLTMRHDLRTGTTSPWARTDEAFEDIFPPFLAKRGWHTSSPLWRRSVCDEIGPWGDFRVMEDWEHDLRAGMIGVKAVWVPEHLCTVRDHSEIRASGMDSGFSRELTHDFFRAHESAWSRMKNAQLTEWSYVQRFSRTMFWIARKCGSYGLSSDARAALDYVDEMTELNGQPSVTRLFRAAASLVGWRATSHYAERARRVLKGSKSP